MHFLHMSPQRITATEAFEMPLTPNYLAVEGYCPNSMLCCLVPAEVFLFGESYEAVCHGTVIWLNVCSHVPTSALLSALIKDRYLLKMPTDSLKP